MQRVLSSFDEVPGEAKRWLVNVLESQESLKKEKMGTSDQFQFANYPTPMKDRKTCDKFWELCARARQVACVSLSSYDRGNFNPSCIQLKLFTRSELAENFTQRGVVNIRVGGNDKVSKPHVETMESLVRETLHNNKKVLYLNLFFQFLCRRILSEYLNN